MNQSLESRNQSTHADASADTPPEIRVLVTRATTSLSGKCDLQYQSGCDAERQLHIRMTSSSGRGIFNKQWFAFADLYGILATIPRKSAVVSKTLHELCAGKSTVTAPFVMAALVHLGMLRLIEQVKINDGAEGADAEDLVRAMHTKQYEVCDPSDYQARMATLLALPVGVVIDDTARVEEDTSAKKASAKSLSKSKKAA